jgi:cysteine desulfurase NifS/selenium donor protein
MIYLDYNATTPVDREVAQAMQPVLDTVFGNPSSIHGYGAEAKKVMEMARQQVARLINCDVSELIFTSGGTESNNMAIQGVAKALKDKGRHIITSAIEHPAVSEVCTYLKEEGFDISIIDVNENGWLDPADLEKAIRQDTILISIMHANNEVGTIQEIASIGKIAKKHGIIFHCDAAQSAGKIEVDVQKLEVDLLSIAGHKLYAPKGVGALYIRSGTPIKKLMFGANHEQNIRPGTENVLEIAGLGKAAELAARDLRRNQEHYAMTRDKLWSILSKNLPGIKRNGHPEKCLPNTLSVSFPGVEANTMVSRLEGIAISAGAACHAENIDVSAVLRAMQLPVRYAMGTIRFSTGKYTSEKDIETAARQVIEIVGQLQAAEDRTPLPGSKDIKLTHFTHGLGCACKIEPKKLAAILKQMPVATDPAILVGKDTSDDASVYRINDELAIVQTLDFFTPIVDDPYDFGAIAAANAISDIYAMGAKPLYAQNIVGFPEHVLPLNVLENILLGASDKAREAGIEIIGGHTIEDPEPKFGMVVTGTVHPDKFVSNTGAIPGDMLILTKPIGTGILATALKRGMLSENEKSTLTDIMAFLNKKAAETMLSFRVHACTDITGFGLLGHLLEMSKGSGCDVTLNSKEIPLIPGAKEMAAAGIVPGGSKENLEHVLDMVDFDGLPLHSRLLLADAQTSGGLLIAVHPEDADDLLSLLKNQGLKTSALIGEFSRKGPGNISIKANQY